MWYKNKIEASPGETVYEVITEEDGTPFGIAVAEIEQSREHHHNKTTEIYIVLGGELILTLGDRAVVLRTGDTFTVRPGLSHSARSSTNQRAVVQVTSIPPWTPEDHHVEE